MKKTLLTASICVLLTAISSISFAQRLSIGEFTGINFSNLHGNLISNKWVPKSGPNTGFFLEYSLNRSFSVQTEIGFLTYYYEMKSYSNIRQNPDIYYLSSSYHPSTITSPVYESNKWDFSFLRLPLLVKYNTPGRLQLGLGGGVFYSLLMDDDITKENRNAAKNNSYDLYPPTNDWGYLFITDLSYPVTNQLRLFISGRLSTGKKVFINQHSAKNGANELLLGFKFNPNLVNKAKTEDFSRTVSDSSFSRLYIKSGIGVTIGWNSSRKKLGNYSENFGPNTGILLGYRLEEKTVSIQTGVKFERKGYALSDTSLYYHRFASDPRYSGKKVDTKVSLDYLTIPLNLNFSFGDPFSFYANFGAYAGFMVNALCQGTTIRKYANEYNYTIEKIYLNDAVEGYYNSVDWGYMAGVGFQFPFRNNMKFDLGINYNESFNQILKEPNPDANGNMKDDFSIINGSLSFQFGIQIPIAK